jgi:hypothetical protein
MRQGRTDTFEQRAPHRRAGVADVAQGF